MELAKTNEERGPTNPYESNDPHCIVFGRCRSCRALQVAARSNCISCGIAMPVDPEVTGTELTPYQLIKLAKDVLDLTQIKLDPSNNSQRVKEAIGKLKLAYDQLERAELEAFDPQI